MKKFTFKKFMHYIKQKNFPLYIKLFIEIEQINITHVEDYIKDIYSTKFWEGLYSKRFLYQKKELLNIIKIVKKKDKREMFLADGNFLIKTFVPLKASINTNNYTLCKFLINMKKKKNDDNVIFFNLIDFISRAQACGEHFFDIEKILNYSSFSNIAFNYLYSRINKKQALKRFGKIKLNWDYINRTVRDEETPTETISIDDAIGVGFNMARDTNEDLPF